tara:strand:- start:1353 stop:1742 length:390 start_codon:yes stop_codon:yes gene_type:complete
MGELVALSKKVEKRQRRHRRVRRKVVGTAERLRLSVFRSSRHIYAQLIDDVTGRTIVAASSRDGSLGVSETKTNGATTKVSIAQSTGRLLAKKAAALNIRVAVFDRGGYPFHGRVKGLAEGSREGGLVF